MNGPAVAAHVCGAHVADLDRITPLFDAYRQFYGAAPDLAGAHQFLRTRLERDESTLLLAVVRSSHIAGGELERNIDALENVAGENAGDNVVGFAQIYWSFSSISLGGIAVLNDLFVTPSHRGRGIAALLVDAALAHARRAGAIRLELSTQHGNDTALRLYRAKNFVMDSDFAHLSLSITPNPDRS